MEKFLEETGLINDILEYANIFEEVISTEEATEIAKDIVKDLICLHTDEIVVSSAIQKFESRKLQNV